MPMISHQILLNEVAPRPHNSGHHTIESCYTSQFEQHLRAVVGLPLGDTSMKSPAAIMYNILGEDEGDRGIFLAYQLIGRALGIPGATVHWYDKPGDILLRFCFLMFCHISFWFLLNTYLHYCNNMLEMQKQRKMGHITVVGPSGAHVEKCLDSMLNKERFDSQSAG